MGLKPLPLTYFTTTLRANKCSVPMTIVPFWKISPFLMIPAGSICSIFAPFFLLISFACLFISFFMVMSFPGWVAFWKWEKQGLKKWPLWIVCTANSFVCLLILGVHFFCFSYSQSHLKTQNAFWKKISLTTT